LPYERIGNNPKSLFTGDGRCCDACNEIVAEARIHPVGVASEIRRVMEAIARVNPNGVVTNRTAIAAICASRGPVLWARRQQEREQLHAMLLREAPQ
jgi:hypothetical protein